MTRVTVLDERPAYSRWLLHGIIGGVIAGIVFAMFEMVMAVVQLGSESFFMPLRMIGGIALGERALEPATSLVVAGGAGLAVHMMMSALYGATIAMVAAVVPQLRARTAWLVLWASVAGFALWIVNFYVIAPIAGLALVPGWDRPRGAIHRPYLRVRLAARRLPRSIRPSALSPSALSPARA